MGVYKPSKKSVKENLPPIDQGALIAAALICLIETYVHKQPRLTVPECMRHAGLPRNVATNRNIQQRVRRLVNKLDFYSVLAAIDDTLLALHGIQPNPFETPEQAFCERSLKAAVLIHLIDISARDEPLLSACDCMLHAGLPPVVANDPTSVQLLHRLVGLLNLDHVLARVDDILQGHRTLMDPTDMVVVATVIR